MDYVDPLTHTLFWHSSLFAAGSWQVHRVWCDADVQRCHGECIVGADGVPKGTVWLVDGVHPLAVGPHGGERHCRLRRHERVLCQHHRALRRHGGHIHDDRDGGRQHQVRAALCAATSFGVAVARRRDCHAEHVCDNVGIAIVHIAGRR